MSELTREGARTDLMLAQADISYRPKDDSIDMAIEALESQKSGVEKIEKIKTKISAKIDEFCDDEDVDENIIVGLQIALDLIEDCEKESI